MAAVTIWPAPSRIAHFRVTTGISSSTHNILAIVRGPLAGDRAAPRKSNACNHYIVCTRNDDFGRVHVRTWPKSGYMDGISDMAATGGQSDPVVGAFQQFAQNRNQSVRFCAFRVSAHFVPSAVYSQ